ncbi:hypothetical protein E3T33_13095 [Cryobacterium sp. TMT1-2-1]|uniref:hypothetical protein n=1 Tax=Cryobacterium sp. TMT1-2-1 TaxID=1259232 RepID=UPI00106C7222|nr:hypothetical protein [Cryobacterium sp. TMT1-2-1]TFD41978.1 hypothetical protein E3T33_13095 [Cryobacterium sp. TMT1-2-1]
MHIRHGSLIAGALVLCLTGCATAQTDAGGPATSIPPATPTSSPATPAASATCDTVLADAEYASLATDGMDLAADTSALGSAMQAMIDAGGLACVWEKSEGDVRVWFAQVDLDAPGWDAKRAELLAAGYTEGDAPFTGTLTAPKDYDPNYTPALYHRDGVLYFVSYPEFLGSVLALQ